LEKLLKFKIHLITDKAESLILLSILNSGKGGPTLISLLIKKPCNWKELIHSSKLPTKLGFNCIEKIQQLKNH